MLYRHYDEAVYYNLPVWNPVLLSAIFLTILLFELIIRHCIICLKQKMLTLGKIAMITILIMASFLFFRNGFTRADGIHYAEFFAISPFLIIAILFITASDNNKQSKIIAIVAIVISSYNLILPQVVKQSINLRLLTPVAYFTDVFQEQRLYKSNMLLNENENKLLGNSTIDILPDRIALLDNSNLNYAPRPVPQSYTVYTKDLDSINATYFYKQLRPEYVLIKAGHFDNRYDFWNESLTKASLHLNYTCKDNQMQDYLLLSSKNNSTYPQFEVQNTRVINLTDTVYINNPDSIVCYMTAKINYTFWGEVYRMLYSAPKLNIIFFLEDGTSQEYQVVCPMLNIPSLISKSITTNNDMKNFFSGCVKKCKNIKAFTLHPRSAGFAIKYTLTFLKFSNY